jgi:hypothetical protein
VQQPLQTLQVAPRAHKLANKGVDAALRKLISDDADSGHIEGSRSAQSRFHDAAVAAGGDANPRGC